MGTFILLVIIAVIVWPLVRAWLTVRRMRNAAREAQQQFSREAERRRREQRRGGWSAPRGGASGKKFNSTEGEYVEFEEVSTRTDSADPSAGAKQTTVRSESQIVDVEWEEL